MDALRKSVQPEEPAPPKKAPSRSAAAKSTPAAAKKKGIALVKTKGPQVGVIGDGDKT
jgi:hypothetical protein